MKIYNKNQFIEGIFMVILGTANLITGIIKHSADMKGIILTTALLVFAYAISMFTHLFVFIYYEQHN